MPETPVDVTPIDVALNKVTPELVKANLEKNTPPPPEAKATPPAPAAAAPPQAKAAPEEPEAAIETEEPEEEDVLSVPKESLDKIKANPELHALYKGMSKAFTVGRQAIAEERASMKQAMELINSIREDPAGTARVIAQAAGLKIAEEAAAGAKPDQVVDEIVGEMARVVGPDIARGFSPILTKAIDKRIKEVLQTELAPIQERTDEIVNRNIQAQSNSEVEQFKARHPGVVTAEVEAKMVQLSKQFSAAEDADPQEYMDGLLIMATAGKTRAAATKEVVARMETAARTAEPVAPVAAPQVESGFNPKAYLSDGKNPTRLDDALEAVWTLAREKARQTA